MSGANKAVDLTTVRATLKRIAVSKKGRPVVIHAPKTAAFGNVVTFVNECERAGVQNIRFVAQ